MNPSQDNAAPRPTEQQGEGKTPRTDDIEGVIQREKAVVEKLRKQGLLPPELPRGETDTAGTLYFKNKIINIRELHLEITELRARAEKAERELVEAKANYEAEDYNHDITKGELKAVQFAHRKFADELREARAQLQAVQGANLRTHAQETLRIATEADAACSKLSREQREIRRVEQGAFYAGKAAAYQHIAAHLENLLKHWPLTPPPQAEHKT